MSASGDASIKLYDEAFNEFCARPELPDFDYIGLHGIWSWISDENRAVITEFIRRKLKVGGVLYISYNTQPGWTAMLPMRELLTQHVDVLGASGQGMGAQIDAALEFADAMLSTQPVYAKANPQVIERIKKMKDQNRNYLAHEYFNRDWLPMSFARMSQWLATAKLSYACSAHYIDHIDAVNLSNQQQEFLKKIPNSLFRQTVRDFMCNTQFRRDYWIKGERSLGAIERIDLLRKQRVVLVNDKNSIEFKISGPIGAANLTETIYKPLIELLAQQYKPYTLQQLEQALSAEKISFAQILQAVMVLIGKGDAAVAHEDAVISKVKNNTEKLNVHLMNISRDRNDIAYLVSPVTGGAISINRFQQLFLLARHQGKKTPEEWAEYVWAHLNLLNQRLNKEGKMIESADENIAELNRQAKEFADKRLPILKALQIA
ncbi:MAG: methyltransferase regulatory domain-containing protein [Nitrosomonas sp.]